MYEHLYLEEEQQQVASSQWNWHWHRNNCWRLESTNHERAVNAIQSVRSSDRSIWGLECCMRAELGIIRHNMLNMLTEAMRMGRSTGHSWQLCKLPVRQTNLKYASPNLPSPFCSPFSSWHEMTDRLHKRRLACLATGLEELQKLFQSLRCLWPVRRLTFSLASTVSWRWEHPPTEQCLGLRPPSFRSGLDTPVSGYVIMDVHKYLKLIIKEFPILLSINLASSLNSFAVRWIS